MLRLLVTLLASLTAPLIVNTWLFQDYIYSIGYVEYKVARASVYLLFSMLCLSMARKEHQLKNNSSAILICILCLFMTINALFNLIMINKDIYYSLACLKRGLNCSSLSFHDIYTAVEILIAFIVGGNGLIRIASVVICACGRWNGIIRHYINSNQGKH